MITAANMKLTGYRRPDGRYGIRNHVIILPVDDISNAAAEGVASLAIQKSQSTLYVVAVPGRVRQSYKSG